MISLDPAEQESVEATLLKGAADSPPSPQRREIAELPVSAVNAGGVFYESPTDVHIVSRNASETQPAKLAVFYVKAKGTPPTVILHEGDK
jgi:hypothetical protein